MSTDAKRVSRARIFAQMHLTRRRRGSSVPADLVARIDEALAEVDSTRAALTTAEPGPDGLSARRDAHARVRTAFEVADDLLRQAVALARSGPSLNWSWWRGRLSRLDARRQAYLFAESDDSGVLLPGSVRVVDYGMSGPDIGEIQHGGSVPAGTPARIGLDQMTMLPRPAQVHMVGSAAAPPAPEQSEGHVLAA